MSDDIIVENVPRKLSDLARRRTHAILRSCWSQPDALALLMRSCYLQGLIDGHEAASRARERVAAAPPDPPE